MVSTAHHIAAGMESNTKGCASPSIMYISEALRVRIRHSTNTTAPMAWASSRITASGS